MQKELPSLCTEQEGRQEFFRLFERPSRYLFVRKEGWFLPRPLACELKSLGLGNVLQEESLSLCAELEGRQGFS